MNPTSQVTLATIAAHLGVSRSTISNAYNHPDQLSPQLRQKILDTAEKLGYNGPDPVARRLRKGRAGAIGVLFSEPLQTAFADPASVLFLEGIAQAGEEQESGVLLIPAKPSPENAHIVQEAMVDGFVLYSIPPGHPFVDAALKRRVPVVCVDQTRIGGTSWIGIDDRAMAQEAANHLIGLGHRNIGILVYGLGAEYDEESDGQVRKCPSVSWLRMEGWQDAFREAGLDWSAVDVRECATNSAEDAQKAIAELLDGPNAPTAVLCSSDTLAIGAIEAASQAGLEVPGSLSVVGFNDTPEAEEHNLTTIRQPLREKGRLAAQLLLDGQAQADSNQHLEASLVVRQTTDRPGR
jgi:DNA-binding LacI/PurR family transcriptional regulator